MTTTPPNHPDGSPAAGGAAGQPLGSEYTVFELIGRGAMGEVRRAVTREGVSVAVKLLRPEIGEDPALVSRFLQERTILTGLDHPHVVRVRDLVAEGSTLAIVMDLVAGRDLRRELADRGTLPPAEAAGLIAQVLAGLSAVHAAGVVHRDLKPENVLLDRGDGSAPQVPRISDFGISSLAERTRGTQRTGPIGTPEYMAPELIDDRPATPASDLYAVGIMLYELLCGVTPFQAQSTLALMNKHAQQPPPRPDGVPDTLWSLIASLLAKDPAQRPPTAADVAAYLDSLRPSLAELPALAPLTEPPQADGTATLLRSTVPTSSPDRPRPRDRRRFLMVASVLGALLLAGGGVAAALAMSGRDDGTAEAGTDTTPTSTPVPTDSPTATPTELPTDAPSPSPSGSGGSLTVLPDFAGKQLSDVVDALDEFDVGYTVREVFGTDAADNEVVEQFPAAGQPPGSRVTLTVARTSASVYLTDLGAIGDDPSTEPVDIDGRTYSHPLSGQISCGSEDTVWQYDLGQEYRRLEGTAGIVDNSSNAAAASVEIFADNRKLWGKSVGLGRPASFDVDVTEVLRLRIVVKGTRCGDDATSYVALGDPRVLSPGGPGATP